MYTLFSGIPAPVLARCHAGLFTEDLREIRLRRKADAGGYLSYRQIGGHQKPLAGFQPPVCQVIDRRLSDTFGKGVCQIEFVDMCDLRQGIQCYSGTQKKKLSQIEAEVVWLQAIAHTCEAEHGVELKEIEYGPGLSVDYFVTDKCDAMNADFDELKEFAVMIKEMSEKFNVTLEMGRYIAATCGILISRIADMKMNDTTRYAIIDSGINHINYYGQAMAMKKPRCEFIPMEYTEGFADGVDHEVEVYSQGVQPYNICGSLCTVGDVIVKNLELKDAKIGDMIAFYNIGAYSVTEGIYLFLSRRMPAIVMYSKKNGYRVIRKPIETFLINSSNTQ